jgi:glutaredoxin
MRYLKMLCIIAVVIIFSGCTSKPPVQNQTNTTSSIPIPPGNFYFYSATCPHCTTVNTFVNDNKIKERGIHFFELEISGLSANADLLKVIGTRCQINENDLSVPLLWYNQTCYTGSDEIIKYLGSLKPDTIN